MTTASAVQLAKRTGKVSWRIITATLGFVAAIIEAILTKKPYGKDLSYLETPRHMREFEESLKPPFSDVPVNFNNENFDNNSF